MAAGLVKGEGFAVDASIIKADASRQRGVAGDEVDWRDPKLSNRAVREYLEALDEEALTEALPKKISLTDPQSRWTAAPGGPAFFAYSTNLPDRHRTRCDHGCGSDSGAPYRRSRFN